MFSPRDFDLNVAYVVCRHLQEPLTVTRLFKKCREDLHIAQPTLKKYLACLQDYGLLEELLLPVVNPCGRGLVAFQSGRQKHFARHAWQLTEKGKIFMREFERLTMFVEDQVHELCKIAY